MPYFTSIKPQKDGNMLMEVSIRMYVVCMYVCMYVCMKVSCA